jgi:hypothetical protein
MQRRWTIGSVTVVALALGLLLPPADMAQAQSKNSAQPAPAASGPYKAVAVTLPERSKDPSLDAFRKTLAGIAERKDKAALAKLLHKGFFWQRESGNGADPKKSAMANFSKAIGLDNREDPDAGWEAIVIYAEDPTAFALSDRQGVVCGPADPGFEEDALQALTESTKSDIGDWVYPLEAGVELRSAARADAPVTDKVGLTFVRVIGSDGPEDANPAAAEFLNVMLPSGKSGFVKIEDVAALSVSQLCYIKDGGNWKIAGVLGGAE